MDTGLSVGNKKSLDPTGPWGYIRGLRQKRRY
jgi:hypothetical protein